MAKTEPTWISPEQAAKILGDVSRSTVYRSLVDAVRADQWWGPGNWRRKPLTGRREYQLRRTRVIELADSGLPFAEPGDGPPPSG